MVQLPDPAESLSPQTELAMTVRAEMYERMATENQEGRGEECARLAATYRRLIALYAPPVLRRDG